MADFRGMYHYSQNMMTPEERKAMELKWEQIRKQQRKRDIVVIIFKILASIVLIGFAAGILLFPVWVWLAQGEWVMVSFVPTIIIGAFAFMFLVWGLAYFVFEY